MTNVTRRAALGGLALFPATAGAAVAGGFKMPGGKLDPAATGAHVPSGNMSTGNVPQENVSAAGDSLGFLAEQLGNALTDHDGGRWFAIVKPATSPDNPAAWLLRPIRALPEAMGVLPSSPFDYVRAMRDDGFVFVCRGDRDTINDYAIRKATKTGRDATADFLLALARQVTA